MLPILQSRPRPYAHHTNLEAISALIAHSGLIKKLRKSSCLGSQNGLHPADGGLTWKAVLKGVSCRIQFLKIDHSSPNIVWIGAESIVFAPCLLKSTDSGENRQQLSPWQGGDNACHAIAIHPSNPDLAYVPMEGLVTQAANGGDDWSVVFDEGHSYLYTIAIDPDNPSAFPGRSYPCNRSGNHP